MFRPLRLLENWSKFELGSFWSRVQPHAKVLKVEYAGEQEVIAIETTEKTLITNGFLSHNCGREAKFYNNCFTLKAEEDTREEWSRLAAHAMSCLTSGGGIGVDYSIIRGSGEPLKRTGGVASGPIPLMSIINEIGRNVMQGGSRRSAIWAGLHWNHKDIRSFLNLKNWDPEVVRLKGLDFNFPATLDMTNTSIQWDTPFLLRPTGSLWEDSVLQMCRTGEPGHAYNFSENEKDVCRNA
jgi:ribonucleoside-diphosphate reductase alpha chain